MSEWKTYKLGDLIECIIDNRGKSAPISISNYQPIIEINALGQREVNYDVIRKYVSKETYDTWFRAGHPKIGDILFSTVGTIGLTSLMTQDLGCIAQNIIALRVNDKLLNNLYLYYFLNNKTTKINLNNLNIGGVQPSIKLPHLLSMPISLPPLEEQKRIADILSAIDDKIELNRRINANLERQAQALYKSWFVDFEPFGGKMPEDWRVGTLGEICITNKRSYSGKFYNSFEYLDTGSVTSNKIDTIQLLNPTIDKIPSRARRAVTEGDILYSSVRPNQKHYMFLYNPSSNMVVSTGFIVITANWSGYRYYIYQYLIQDIVIQHLQSIAEQSVSTYPSINASDITNLEINIPSNKAIEKYANVMNPIMKQITNNQSENLRLAQLRDTLLPKLMSGEITV